MLRIVVERNGEIVCDQALSQKLISIGRGEDNDVVLSDEQVSSRHLVVKTGSDGVFTAIDQSANGTSYDGQRISTLRVTAPVVLNVADYEITLIPSSPTDTVESGVPGDRDVTETEELPRSRPPVVPTDSRPQARLAIELDGKREVVTFIDSAMVGRDPECDLRIQSREVSRKHAFFYRRGEQFLVKRISRVNPVRVSGRPVSQGESALLEDGDEVDISGYTLVFRRTGAAGDGRPTLVEGRQPNIGFSVDLRWESREVVRADLLGFLGEKTAPRFEVEVLDSLAGARRVTVDLGYLIGIDENGLGALVRLAAECDRHGIHLRLANVGPRVLDALAGSSKRKILEPYIERPTQPARPAWETS